MTVGIELGSITDEIGAASFFNAFFSTISGNLEPDGWGSRFPIIMNKLYSGVVSQSDSVKALSELEVIKSELATLSAYKIIWDIKDYKKMPPWESNISADITDLSNYFVTSTGRDLISSLKEILEELRDRGGLAKVVTM